MGEHKGLCVTLRELSRYGWPLPRGLLQVTRDDIDRRLAQASQQLKRFRPSQQLVEGKLHTIPSPEGERLALAAVRCTWDLTVPHVKREELYDLTRVFTQLFGVRPFSDYSEAIRPLIGELESETATHLDKAPAKRRGRTPNEQIGNRNAVIKANPNLTNQKLCQLLDNGRKAPPAQWGKSTWKEAYQDPETRKKVHRLFSDVRHK